MSDSQQAQPAAEMPVSPHPQPLPIEGRGEEPDPEIAALLGFEPVPRARHVEGAWTPELQRELVARIAAHGSIQQACDEMGKDRTGVTRLQKHKRGASFCAAVDGAIELARQRLAEVPAIVDRMEPRTRLAIIDYRRKRPLAPEQDGPLPGQVLNEYGEWEDEDSVQRRGEEARDSICGKLLRIRRQYLQEISGSPAKRAAFEILTELPIDWEKAERCEPQSDEPWRRTNQREPDMILMAESGWSMGEHGYGPDKKTEQRKAIDAYRAEQGLEPVDWDGD